MEREIVMKLFSAMEKPRPHEALTYTSDHGYANDTEFLFAAARWIVEQGGSVSLLSLEEEAVDGAPAPFELQVHDLDSQDTAVFEPTDTLVHFGHGVFGVLGSDYFATAYTVDAVADPLDPVTWKTDPSASTWVTFSSAMVTDPPQNAPSDVWSTLMERAREFIAGTPLIAVDPIAELVEAIRHTVEYVGLEKLPPVEGWSWFDVLSKYAPEVVAEFQQQAAKQSAPYMPAGWPGLKDGDRVGVDVDGSVFIGVAKNTPEGLTIEGIPVEAEDPVAEEPAVPVSVPVSDERRGYGLPCGEYSGGQRGQWCDRITGHPGFHSWKTDTSAVDDPKAADLANGATGTSTEATGTGDA